jgi:hypothetical protein
MRRASVAMMVAATLALLPGVGRVKANDDESRDSDFGRSRIRFFRADLFGDNEVPPVFTRGRGQLTMFLDPLAAEGTLRFRLTYERLSTPIGVAHVHFAPPGINGGVMYFFCGGGGQAACPSDANTDSAGVVTYSGTVVGMVTIANVLGPATQGINPADPERFAKVLDIMRSGRSYANVHTAQSPGGEVRGPVRPR